MAELIDAKAALEDPAVRLLGLTIWEARKLLGFDNDGDEHPWASMVTGIEGYAASFLVDMQGVRQEMEELIEDLEQIDVSLGETLSRVQAPEPEPDQEAPIVGIGGEGDQMYYVRRRVRGKVYVIEYGDGTIGHVSVQEAADASDHVVLGVKGAARFYVLWGRKYE